MYIKKILIYSLFSFCFFVSHGQNNNDWLIQYEEVYQKSISENKPILANFTGSDWCGWCKKLKKAVFDTEIFKKWAKENVILFELDYPRRSAQDPEIKIQNEQLRQTFQQYVRGYPTVLIFKVERTFGEDGKRDKDNIELYAGKLGYMPTPSSFIEKASNIIEANKK
tara:strand:+ start:9580 stop:10080 length:501 start_codon:yes stop_codon:yes gene_type:complete